MADDFVRYNGRVAGNKSCLFTVAMLPVNGIKSVKFSDTVDMPIVKGANRTGVALGSTSGTYSVDTFTMTILKDVWVTVLGPYLAAQALVLGLSGGLSGFEWDFTSQIIEEPFLTSTDTVSNCRISKLEDGYDEGAEALVINMTMAGRMSVNRNGITLYDPLRDLL